MAKKNKSADPAAGELETQTERIPHGAQHLADLHSCCELAKGLIEQERDVLDHEGVRNVAEDLHKSLSEHTETLQGAFAKHYPDLEGLGEGKSEEGDEPEESGDKPLPDNEGGKPREEDDEEDVVKNLSPKRKALAKKGKTAPAEGKRLSKYARCVCKDAAEFLDDHSEHESLEKRDKAACRYHAKTLHELADKGMEAEDDDQADEGGAKVPEMDDSEKSFLAGQLAKLTAQAEANGAALKKATVQK